MSAVNELDPTELDILLRVVSSVAPAEEMSLLERQIRTTSITRGEEDGEIHLHPDAQFRGSSEIASITMIDVDTSGAETIVDVAIVYGLIAAVKCFRTEDGYFAGWPVLGSLRPM